MTRAVLLALGRVTRDPTMTELAADGVRRLDWSGSWLDEPYVPSSAGKEPGTSLGSDALEGRLRELTDAFAELVEDLEEDDPVRNANGVQAGSLAFAVTGATAARLHRLSAGHRSER